MKSLMIFMSLLLLEFTVVRLIFNSDKTELIAVETQTVNKDSIHNVVILPTSIKLDYDKDISNDKSATSIQKDIYHPPYKAKNGIEELYYNSRGKALSDWDKARWEIYDLSNTMKKTYPDIPATTTQLYDWWAKTIYAECKFKIGDGAINKISDARGCIQWLPSTRKKLGVPDTIHLMPLNEQIPYVTDYIDYKLKTHKINTSKINDFTDIYCIVFAPDVTDSRDNKSVYKACHRRSKHYNCEAYKAILKGEYTGRRSEYKHCSYHANSAYDVNKSGNIRKHEIGEYILNKHYKTE